MLAYMLATTPIHAQTIDFSRGGPITVTAAGGIDWNQGDKTVTAHGDARALRGNATITSDRLIARYRPKAAAKPVAPPPSALPGGDTGGNEIYRLEAHGNVHIFTATDQGFGDDAVYDIDSAVVVLTGRALKMTTPTSVLTARDDIEYYPQTKIAVARGDAVAISNDAKRIRADVLVAYMTDGPAPVPVKVPVKVDDKKLGKSSDSAEDALNGGKVERVEAYGHVDVRTLTDMVTGDRGLYLPPTGIARVLGHVHITRGANQLNGAAAIINMKTGIATLTEAPGERVQGLIVPNAPQPAMPGGK
jgi:lipopolysaccharide export system protein LptA